MRTAPAVDAMTFTLESNGPDGLCGTTWSFVVFDGKLVVDTYERWRRSSAPSKPKIEARWHRMFPAESTVTKAKAPFTPVIGTWAKAEWLKHLDRTVAVGFQD